MGYLLQSLLLLVVIVSLQTWICLLFVPLPTVRSEKYGEAIIVSSPGILLVNAEPKFSRRDMLDFVLDFYEPFYDSGTYIKAVTTNVNTHLFRNLHKKLLVVCGIAAEFCQHGAGG